MLSKKSCNQLLFVVSMLWYCCSAYAQDFPLSEFSVYAKSVVKNNGVYSMLEGDSLKLNIEYSDSIKDASSVESVLLVNAEENMDSVAYNADSCFITFSCEKEIVDLKVGMNKFWIVLNYKDLEGTEKSIVLSDTVTVNVYMSPRAGIVAYPTEKEYISPTPTLEWTTEVTGGYDNGWIYKWMVNDEETDGEVLSHTFDNPGIYYVNLSVENRAPDGETDWYKYDSYKDTIIVYAEPAAMIDAEPESSYNNVKDETDIIKFSIMTDGGNDGIWTESENRGWKFVWKVDDEEPLTGSSVMGKSFGIGKHTVSVEVSNFSNSGIELFKTTLTFKEFDVHAPISISMESQPEKRSYYQSADNLQWVLVHSGGVEDESAWQYEWKDNGEVVGHGSSLTMSYSTVEEKTEHVISYEVRNMSGDEILGTASGECVIVLYPEASIAIDKQPSYHVYYKETGELEWAVKASGGNDSGWKYSWKINGTEEGASSVFKKNILDDSYVKTITLTVTNSSPEGEVWYSYDSYSYEITMLSSIEIALEEQNSGYYLLSKANPTFSAQPYGDNAEGWTYTWKMDGTTYGADQIFTPTFETAGNYNVILEATNKSPEIDSVFVYKELTSNLIVIYEDPQYRVKENEKTIYFYSTSGLKYEIASVYGGNPEGWEYVWEMDGDKYSGSSFSPETITNDTNDIIVKTVTLSVVNKAPNGEELYRNTESFSFEIRPIGVEVTGPSEVTYYYEKANVSWNAVPKGHNQEGWRYGWEASNGATSDQAFFSQQFTQPGTYTVRLVAGNYDDNKLQFEREFVYTVVVYPTAQVNYSEPSDTEYYMKADNVSFAVTTTGANPGGWKYSWTTSDGENFQGTSFFRSYENNADEIKTVKVSMYAYNEDPEGNEIFRSKEYETILTIYPYADVEIVSPSVLDFYVRTGDMSFSANPVGGNAAEWKYLWTADGNVDGQNANYKPSFENNGSALKEFVVKLHAENCSQSGKVLKTYDNEMMVRVYPEAKVTETVPSRLEFYEIAKNAYFALNVEGGNPNQDTWIFEWKLDGKVVSTNKSYTFNYTNDTKLTQYRMLTVSIKNVGTDGKTIWFTKELSYSITILPRGDFDIVSSTDNLHFYKTTGNDGVTWKVVPKAETEKYNWTYRWYINDKAAGATNEYTYKPSMAPVKHEIVRIKVVIKAVDADGAIKVDTEREFDVHIYPEASVSMQNQPKLAYCGKVSDTWSINSAGGNENGWEYSWIIKDGNGESTADTKVFNYRSDAPAVKTTNNVKVSIRNYSPNRDDDPEPWKEANYSYSFTIYPSASATIDASEVIGYYGTTHPIKVSSNGGYDDNGWSYKWTENGTVIGSARTIDYYISEKQNTSDYQSSISVDVKNTYTPNSEVWFDNKYTVNVKAYSRGKVNPIQSNLKNDNVSAGTSITLSAKVEGGYPDGWTYKWTDNGKEIKGANIPTYSFNADADGNDKEVKHVYRLTAVNKIGNVEGGSYTQEYTIVVWPKPDFSQVQGLMDKNGAHSGDFISIREGNTLMVPVELIRGGYHPDDEKSWSYTWKVDGVVQDINMPFIEVPITEGKEMRKYEMTYSAVVKNYGPDGSVWTTSDEYKKTFNIYRRPETPQKLVVKGNGTSGTLVAMTSGLTDAELQQYKYEMVFGYDSNGHSFIKDSVKVVGTPIRYDRFSPNELNNSGNRFWVYAQWLYPDGVKITSGKCFLDGTIDEEFDGSSYMLPTRTHGDATAIYDVSHEESIVIEHNRYEVNLEFPVDIWFKIYDLSGSIIEQRCYSDCIHISDRIDLSRMSSGIYIVEIIAGNERKIKKMYNKR